MHPTPSFSSLPMTKCTRTCCGEAGERGCGVCVCARDYAEQVICARTHTHAHTHMHEPSFHNLPMPAFPGLTTAGQTISGSVASLKCQTCLVSGNECKEEDVKMVECKDNEEVCFSIIVNTTLTNVSMSLVIKGCSKPEECYEGFYSTTTVDGRFELAKTYCCQTDGCNAKPLLLQNYDELQPNGLQCPGCYVQDADSCEGHQPVICIDKEDQCLNLTSSMQAFGNYTDKYSFQGCATKNSCSYPKGESQIANGIFYFNVTTLECRNASSHNPDLQW